MADKTKVQRVKDVAKRANPLNLLKNIVRFLANSTGFVGRFFRDAVNEMRTVTWLSRKDTVKFTVYILLFIFVSAFAIAMIDLGLYKLVTFITTRS